MNVNDRKCERSNARMIRSPIDYSSNSLRTLQKVTFFHTQLVCKRSIRIHKVIFIFSCHLSCLHLMPLVWKAWSGVLIQFQCSGPSYLWNLICQQKGLTDPGSEPLKSLVNKDNSLVRKRTGTALNRITEHINLNNW